MFVAIGLYVTKAMMFGTGSKRTGMMIASLIIGVALVIWLDRRYWLIYPFLAYSGISIKGLPFDGVEVGCLVVCSVHFVRMGLHRDVSAKAESRDFLFVWPVFLWIAGVYCLNPAGLAMFGTSAIGARFYFLVAVGFFAMFSLSAQKITEADAKMFFFTLLASFLIALIRGLVSAPTDPDSVVFDGDLPERSTRYTFVVCSSIYTLLFSRWSISDVLRSFGKFIVMFILAALSIYSGKRRSFAALALVPLIRSLLTRRERMITFVIGVFACVMLLFSAVGDGTIYRLPKSAKRALAVVIPKYRNASGDGGTKDLFREELRKQARHVIAANPLLGRKGFAMDLSETSWILYGGGRTSLFAGHAYAGNWHSTWYAFAADFGLPCMFLWALFVIHLLRFCLRVGRTVDTSSWLGACCMFYVFLILIEIIFSYTTGHSARTSAGMWTAYGLLVAMFRSYNETRRLYFPVQPCM